MNDERLVYWCRFIRGSFVNLADAETENLGHMFLNRGHSLYLGICKEWSCRLLFRIAFEPSRFGKSNSFLHTYCFQYLCCYSLWLGYTCISSHSLHVFVLQFYSLTLWLQEGNNSRLLEESVWLKLCAHCIRDCRTLLSSTSALVCACAA